MDRNLARKLDSVESNGAIAIKIHCKPFIKWVGGKGQLLPELRKRIPSNIRRYYEPFIGGGALLFNYQPQQAYISDLNSELINAYQVIKTDVESIIKYLKSHYYEEKYYYKIRDIDREPAYRKWSPSKKAARLIFLNKTCFNGLYRVNSKGFFNTPFGKYSNPKILDADNLRACSEVLQSVDIRLAGFQAIEDSITKDDFVYFDPPYVPLSATSYFTGYNSSGFDLEMQRELYELCCRLNKKEVRFMLSNSSAPFVLELYKEFRIERVAASRAINSNSAKRGRIEEVIVTNY